jgi:putative DNA primase/helicase
MSDLVDLNDLPETWLPETRPDTRPEIWDDFLGAGPIFDVDKFLEDNNVPILGKKVKDGYTIWEIPCVFRPGEKDGGMWIRQNSDGTIYAGCNHAKCKGKGWKQIRKAIDSKFDEKAKDGLPVKIDDAERLARCHLAKYLNRLVLYKESVCEYQAGIWQERQSESIKREIRRTIMDEFNAYGQQIKERGLDTKPPSISESLVNSVYGVLTSLIPEITTPAPCWLDGRAANNLIVMENGILNLDDLSKTDHTPELFSFIKIPFGYDPLATCPIWIMFLGSLWDDPKSRELLQEIIGYTLRQGNPMEVMVLLQGASRGGKGVILFIVGNLVGAANYCSIHIRSFTKSFALWAARNKLVIFIPDIHAPKHGLPSDAMEVLKGISGLENMEIEGKHRDAVTETLQGIIFASSNDLIEFNDPSGALLNRLLVLKHTKSFLPPDNDDYVPGQEQDTTLKDKLLTELPGILNWALIGLKRITENKQFAQPAASKYLKNELREEGSPIKQFVKDCLVHKVDGVALVDDVFTQWETWCQSHDYGSDVVGTKQMFGKLVRVACPAVKRDKAMKKDKTGQRPHEYRGIELKCLH